MTVASSTGLFPTGYGCHLPVGDVGGYVSARHLERRFRPLSNVVQRKVQQDEPDAIGYATSADGINWTKNPLPVFSSDDSLAWEQAKVTACQVLKHGEWYYMFDIGFRNVHQAAIGIARSLNGIDGWSGILKT